MFIHTERQTDIYFVGAATPPTAYYIHVYVSMFFFNNQKGNKAHYLDSNCSLLWQLWRQHGACANIAMRRHRWLVVQGAVLAFISQITVKERERERNLEYSSTRKRDREIVNLLICMQLIQIGGGHNVRLQLGLLLIEGADASSIVVVDNRITGDAHTRICKR